MRKKHFFDFMKKRTVIAGLSLCMVSLVAMAGIYRIEKAKEKEKEIGDLGQELEKGSYTFETADGSISLDETLDRLIETPAENQPLIIDETHYDEVTEPREQEVEATIAEAESTQESVQTETQEVGAKSVLSFDSSSKINWPVKGNVIIPYSMDATVHFSTLDVYKYNPAIIIQGDVNTNVTAGCEGVVESIGQNEEIGQFVVLNLGNGYTATYGQLKSLQVEEGQKVKKDTVLGCINEPTKYYSVEGSNLYFQMKENDTVVNPMDYLQ